VRLDDRMHGLMHGLRGAMVGDRDAVRIFREKYLDFPDPEGLYLQARGAAHVGLIDDALIMLDLVERNGFFCYAFFLRDAWLDPLRGDPRLNAILHRAEVRWREAKSAFENHPGSRVLTIGAR